jgi:hypothetical protein
MSTIHMSFSVEHAEKYGLNEAIMIHHFQHWIEYNRTMKRNLIEGRTWTYQTQEEIAGHFTFWTRDQVQYLLNKLVDKGILRKGNFNKNTFLRTQWYAFENEKMFTKVEISTMDSGKVHNPKRKSPQSIYTDDKPDHKTEDKSSSSEESNIDDACGADDDTPTPIDFSKEIGDLKVVSSKGEIIKVSIESIFSHFVKLNYTTEVVREAIEAVKEVDQPINNVMKYLDSCCRSIINGKSRKTKKKQGLTPDEIIARIPQPNPETETVSFTEYEARLKREGKIV